MNEHTKYVNVGKNKILNYNNQQCIIETSVHSLYDEEKATLKITYQNLVTKDKETRIFRAGQEIDSYAVLGDESGDRSNLERYVERSKLKEAERMYTQFPTFASQFTNIELYRDIVGNFLKQPEKRMHKIKADNN